MEQRGFPGEKTSELGRKRIGAAGRESGLDKGVRAGKTLSCTEGKLEFGMVRIKVCGGLTFCRNKKITITEVGIALTEYQTLSSARNIPSFI